MGTKTLRLINQEDGIDIYEGEIDSVVRIDKGNEIHLTIHANHSPGYFMVWEGEVVNVTAYTYPSGQDKLLVAVSTVERKTRR